MDYILQIINIIKSSSQRINHNNPDQLSYDWFNNELIIYHNDNHAPIISSDSTISDIIQVLTFVRYHKSTKLDEDIAEILVKQYDYLVSLGISETKQNLFRQIKEYYKDSSMNLYLLDSKILYKLYISSNYLLIAIQSDNLPRLQHIAYLIDEDIFIGIQAFNNGIEYNLIKNVKNIIKLAPEKYVKKSIKAVLEYWNQNFEENIRAITHSYCFMELQQLYDGDKPIYDNEIFLLELRLRGHLLRDQVNKEIEYLLTIDAQLILREE